MRKRIFAGLALAIAASNAQAQETIDDIGAVAAAG